MTPAIKARAEQIALAEWNLPLDELAEGTRFDITRRAIEADRLDRIRAAIQTARITPNIAPNTAEQARLW